MQQSGQMSFLNAKQKNIQVMSLPTWGRQLYWFCPLHLSAVISVQILRKCLSQRLKSAWVENPNPFGGQWVKGQGHRGQTCEICLISKLAYTLSRRLITERMFSLHEYNPNCFWGQWVKGQGSKCEICFHSNLAHYDRDFKFIQWLVGLRWYQMVKCVCAVMEMRYTKPLFTCNCN